MAFWLARERRDQESRFLQRFDPRFWTVDFPRPAMASVITTSPDSMRVDVELHHKGELVGLIWDSIDAIDHPLLAYETNRDYSNTILSFDWRSERLATLDQPNGPTLTIEGRDAAGQPRTWYVRLWNYATGTNENASVTLPFSQLESGWTLPGEPINPADIDRMFISLVAPGFEPGSEEPLDSRVAGYVRISGIKCDGRHAMLELGDVRLPEHGEQIATAYDDQYNQSPSRIVRSIVGLGYRNEVLHYVGMSHFPRLGYTDQGDLHVLEEGTICTPAAQWHRSFYDLCRKFEFEVISSISYELFDDYCPEPWKQRTSSGEPALTGWVPPSTLLSPANPDAMAWVQASALKFATFHQQENIPVRIQIGEPWWWVTPSGEICLYDDLARIALGGDLPVINDIRSPLAQDQRDLLDDAGSLLAQSTAEFTQVIRAHAPDAEVLLLAFTPTILADDMPDLYRANLPDGWAYPAFDRLQLEDYDWLTAGADALRRSAYSLVDQRLEYPVELTDYLAGFVLDPTDAEDLWPFFDDGLDEARNRGIGRRFVWALPQVARDGYTRLAPTEENPMEAFDDVLYPFALGRNTSVAPEFSTAVAVTASGFENRNSLWSDARMHFDVGPGIRSEAELAELIAFFRARRGAAKGFRISDPFDHSSSGMTGTPTATDQWVGIGDGLRSDFALRKSYGSGDDPQQRPITRPRNETVLISIDGAPASGWSLLPKGIVRFDVAPPSG
ncbi:MAG: DUF2460 domain-containing protein, partial [Pseudomonadota bacterium]